MIIVMLKETFVGLRTSTSFMDEVKHSLGPCEWPCSKVVGPNHLRLQMGNKLLCYDLATIQLVEENHKYASPKRTP